MASPSFKESLLGSCVPTSRCDFSIMDGPSADLNIRIASSIIWVLSKPPMPIKSLSAVFSLLTSILRRLTSLSNRMLAAAPVSTWSSMACSSLSVLDISVVLMKGAGGSYLSSK